MKYLRKFATEADVDVTDEPNVVLVAESGAILYNVKPKGVYVQHIDGILYTPSKWSARGFANDEANGVAVLADECSFVISKECIPGGTAVWGGYGKSLTNITSSQNLSGLLSSYNGEADTAAIISQLTGYTDSEGITGAPAAEACVGFAFPNGKAGYLPSIGEIMVAAEYLDKINSAMSIIEGVALTKAETIFSSSQYNKNYVWGYWWGNLTGPYFYHKFKPYYVRPFASLNI